MTKVSAEKKMTVKHIGIKLWTETEKYKPLTCKDPVLRLWQSLNIFSIISIGLFLHDLSTFLIILSSLFCVGLSSPPIFNFLMSCPLKLRVKLRVIISKTDKTEKSAFSSKVSIF